VEWLRVELRGEPLDLLGIQQIRRAGEALPDIKVVEIKRVGQAS
jgi:hypothetical protein